MPKAKCNKNPTDPIVLRAILDLERAGWARGEVCNLLGLSPRTYFYRKAEVRRLRQRARAVAD